jgi:hypothetical protein
VKYVVTENTPGCMPESEPAVFPNEKAAKDYAFSLVDELLEQGYYIILTDEGDISGRVYMESHSKDLGRVIEWAPTSEE